MQQIPDAQKHLFWDLLTCQGLERYYNVVTGQSIRELISYARQLQHQQYASIATQMMRLESCEYTSPLALLATAKRLPNHTACRLQLVQLEHSHYLPTCMTPEIMCLHVRQVGQPGPQILHL